MGAANTRQDGLLHQPGQAEIGIPTRDPLDGGVREGVQLVAHALNALRKGVLPAVRGCLQVGFDAREGLLVRRVLDEVQGLFEVLLGEE